jgi:hypothetical protein
MTVSDKVIALLNKDERAKRLNTLFNETAKKQGLTGSELADTRQTFLMLLIAKNPEAMQLMANETYNHFNQI